MAIQEIISIQQIRDDPNGFVDGMAAGKVYTVVRRSKKVTTVSAVGSTIDSDKPIPGSNLAIKHSIEIAKHIQKTHKTSLDPNKSIKELYSESMDEKYGFSRR